MQDNASADSLQTLLICYREIAKMLPGVNPDAFFQDIEKDKEKDSLQVCIEIGEKLKISPVHRDDVSIDELASYFGAPLLLQLKNGNWLIFLGVRKQVRDGNEYESFAIFDPLSNSRGHMIFLQRQQLEKAWGNSVVFLKIELTGCSVDGRHTTLYSMVAILKHYQSDVDVPRLVHDYAISEEEPEFRLLSHIADRENFSSKRIKVTWNQLPGINQAFPCMGYKKDGTAVVFCGVREVPVVQEKTDDSANHVKDGSETSANPTEEQTAEPKKKQQLAIWDPVAADGHKPVVTFIEKETFVSDFSGKVVLFKKRYSLSDENQPFGLRWFIPEFLRQKSLLIQVATAILAVSLIALATPLYFQAIVDKVLVSNSRETLLVLTVSVCVLLVFNSILEYLESYFLLFATNKIDIRLATRTFAKLLSLPVDFYEKIASGILIKHMQQTEKIRQFLSGSLFFSILELLSLVIFLPFLLIYSVKLTLIVLAFTGMIAIVIAVLIKPFQRRLEELYLAEGKRQGMLVETIHGIRTVKSLALEPVQQRKWNDTAAFAITRYFRVAKISITAKTLSGLLEKLMFIAIISIGAMSVFDKTMSVGALIAFQMLSGRVTSPLVRIVGLIHEYQQTLLSIKMLGVVMNCPQEQVGGTLHHRLRGELSIENINFQYSSDGPRVIKDFTLQISPGTTVGLVGRSGSGKTTLTKLIQGLYPLQGGIIKYDGIDIREIDRSSLRSNIGIVLQDNYFFQGTIRENLSLTKKDATMEEIIYAARMAGADEFIQKMSKGYESTLEENASNLSGGQRQRLAIARALLPNPRFLIFDEATSALDPESETLIRKNLKMIARNRTVFIISHRLSVLCRADNIVVMDKGALIEQGNHASLIRQNGIYAEFWRQQMGTEEEA